MRISVSMLVLAAVSSLPSFAYAETPSGPAVSSAEIERSIGEAARSLEALSRVMAVMGPGLSRAAQAAAPGVGRAVTAAQPSLARAMAVAQPQLAQMQSNVVTPPVGAASQSTPTGAELAHSMQRAASSLEVLSRIMGSVAPDLGRAYDAAAPELRGALAQARPALEEAIKAAEPELQRLSPQTPQR
jgi:hypothetical protein